MTCAATLQRLTVASNSAVAASTRSSMLPDKNLLKMLSARQLKGGSGAMNS